MKYLLYFVAILASLFSLSAFAADPNGYTALYECRAGGPNCGVDVSALVNQSCQQTITMSTSPTSNWSAINWSNDVICIEAGDHTGRGALTIPSTADGTPSTRKVLRYYRSGDTGDDPWDQGSNQAKLYAIDLNGAAYWIIHRLAIIGSTGSIENVRTTTPGADNNIFNRILAENGASSEAIVGIGNGNNNNVLQNSVVRNGIATPSFDNSCVLVKEGANLWVVNNELYDCTKIVFSEQYNSTPGLVIENNDIYMTTAFYTDCNGNDDPSGACSKGENGISLKADATSANPIRIVNNRIWGVRPSDTSVCCGGGGTQGEIIDLYSGDSDWPGDGVDWVLIQNNIVFDGQKGYHGSGFGSPDRNDRISVIGNLFWDFREYVSGFDYGAIFNRRQTSTEYYLNTVISAAGSWLEVGFEETGNDLRCNVAIASAAATGSAGPGTQINYNAYYGTSSTGESNKTSVTLKTRVNSTSYAVGDIIRLSTNPESSCTATNDSDCFLYKVTVAGRSASTPISYCTALGCTTTDGTMVMQAIRGGYAFKRRLRTISGGETIIVPYAVPHSGAPEAYGCPTMPGTIQGIGVGQLATAQ